MLIIPSRVIAACFALGGFAAATIVGAVAGNPAGTVLLRALVVMAACWLIGHLVGFLASRAVAEHLDTYKQAHPIPDETDAAGAANAANTEGAEVAGTEEETGGAPASTRDVRASSPNTGAKPAAAQAASST